MPDKTTVCRCEDITLKEIRELIEQGYQSIDEIKRISRCGMGACQGRTCRPIVTQEIANTTGQTMDQIKMPKFRPPVKPIKMGILVEGEDGNA